MTQMPQPKPTQLDRIETLEANIASIKNTLKLMSIQHMPQVAPEPTPAPEPEPWDASKLADGEGYWIVADNGEVYISTWRNDDTDKQRLITRNIFENVVDAEYHAIMIERAFVIRGLAFKPDWSDKYQSKFSPFYNHIKEFIDVTSFIDVEDGTTLFETAEQAKAAFKDVANDDFLYMIRAGLI